MKYLNLLLWMDRRLVLIRYRIKVMFLMYNKTISVNSQSIDKDIEHFEFYIIKIMKR